MSQTSERTSGSRDFRCFTVPGIPAISAGDDLPAIITASLDAAGIELVDDDIVVVAQKIVSKAEDQVVNLRDIEPGAEAKELAAAADKDPRFVQVVLNESTRVVRHRPGVIITEHREGFVLANAGIDRSNVDPDEDLVLLLPRNSNQAAGDLRTGLEALTKRRLGVVVADSVGRAWRMGTIGMALGSAGIEALQDLRGARDLHNRELQVSEHALADSVAATAELLMGEAAEATPVVVIRGLRIAGDEQTAEVLVRPSAEDLFR